MLTLADKGGRAGQANTDIGWQRGEGGQTNDDIIDKIEQKLAKILGFIKLILTYW